MENKEINVCVLISCMHQKDHDILKRTNIQTDVVVVNQCDNDSIEEWTFANKNGKTCNVKFINTTERGLSRSRNMAIKNALQSICLICDDDELLEDDYEQKIRGAYNEHQSVDCILFQVKRLDMSQPKQYPVNPGRVGIKQILQSSSVQITFRSDVIVSKGITFDTKLGSGSGNGGGEENKFLLDVKRKGIGIYYVPVNIGSVMTGVSLWYHGVNAEYLRNQGWSSRRSLGTGLGFVYTNLFWLRHNRMIRKEMPPLRGLKYLMQGFFEKR